MIVVFKQINDFAVLTHIALKNTSTRGVVDDNSFIALWPQKRLKLFKFIESTRAFGYTRVLLKLFG